MTRSYRHIFIYDDTVSIGPLATITLADGAQINLWDQLNKANRGLIISKTKSLMSIKRNVWDSIVIWIEGDQFCGLELYDYLNKMFGVKV